MKKLLAISLVTILFTACATDQITEDLQNAQKEATEAVDNLTNEAVNLKDNVTEKIDQINQATDSVSNAVDAVSQAKEDLQTVAGANDEEVDQNTETTN